MNYKNKNLSPPGYSLRRVGAFLRQELEILTQPGTLIYFDNAHRTLKTSIYRQKSAGKIMSQEVYSELRNKLSKAASSV